MFNDRPPCSTVISLNPTTSSESLDAKGVAPHRNAISGVNGRLPILAAPKSVVLDGTGAENTFFDKLFHRIERRCDGDFGHGAHIDMSVRCEPEAPCRGTRRAEKTHARHPRQIGGVQHRGIDPYE